MTEQHPQHPQDPGPWGPPPRPQGDPWAGPGPLPGPRPVPVKPKKNATKIIVAVSAAVTVVLVGALIAASVVASRDSMEAGVERYFEALGKTYSNQLADHVVNVPPAAELEKARRAARNQDYTVREVRTTGSTATVDYVVSGRNETVDLKMRQVDGTWKVVDGFSTLTITSDREGAQFTISHAFDEVAGRTITLYPGTYEIRQDHSGVSPYLWEFDGDDFVTLKPGENKALNPKVTLSRDGEQRVRSVLGSAFSQCATSAEVAPTDCPISVPEPTDRASSYGTWRVNGGSGASSAVRRAEIGDYTEFNNVCATFTAQVAYRYRNAAGFQEIPAAQDTFTGCVDLTEDIPSVTWK